MDGNYVVMLLDLNLSQILIVWLAVLERNAWKYTFSVL